MEGAAFQALTIAKMTKEDSEAYEKMLGEMRENILQDMGDDSDMSDEDLRRVEDIVEKFSDAFIETVKEGTLDGAVVGMMDEGEMNFAGGVHMVNPNRVEDAVKDAVDFAEDKPEVADRFEACLLYTSPSPRDQRGSRMPSSA